MPKHVLVTGADGQVGSEIRRLVSINNDEQLHFFFTDKNSLDITDKRAVETFIQREQIDTIVNCAAYTAVDKAEEEREKTFLINAEAVGHLAELSNRYNIRLIHISTDYVFDGMHHRPYREDDPVNPQSIYGESKLGGEEAIQSINPPGAMIIRTSWVYSTFGSNFVKTMLRLGRERDSLDIIFDQIGTPTNAKYLAEAILTILQTDTGKTDEKSVAIYHYSNEGVCSWYDFAHAIFELSGIDCKVSPILSAQYPTPAKRPHYSVLNKEKIKTTYPIQIPHWKDALEESLPNLLKQ